MTDDELSAKVAEARGELLHTLTFNGDIPPYSTCMTTAWELVKEMGTMAIYPHRKEITFLNAHTNEAERSKESTMPRAICRAYLASKGVEV